MSLASFLKRAEKLRDIDFEVLIFRNRPSPTIGGPMQSAPEDYPRAFRVKEAAAAYGLSRSTLYKLANEGRLRTVKIGGRRLIPRDALEALFAETTK